MKCPKCHYVSHDYLDACRKCGIDLVTFKQDMGLVVLQSGALDLSLVLGGTGVDDLFESIAEEVTMHASDDDDFDISLDDYLEEVVSAGPPPANDVSESPETQDTTASRQLDISHSDFVHLTSAATPEAESNDAARAESVDATVPVTDISRAMAALPLQDIVLADHTPAAVDDAVLTPEVREPSASDIADMAEPALTTLDVPRLQDMELLPSFTDEWAPLTVESIPEDMLTSSDIFILEDMEEAMPPEYLILELDASVLPADLASSFREDATPMTPCDTPQLPETLTGAHTEPPLPPADDTTFADLDDIALPEHLALELRRFEIVHEASSIILDRLQLETPPGDMQSKMPPGEDHAKDEVELLLDLDNLAFDDDKPA